MDTQGRNEGQQFNPDRGRSDAHAKTAAEAVAESLMAPIFPAPAAPQAGVITGRRSKRWFSVATVLTLIALVAGGAAAVAATYGPVFTQPMMGP